MGQKNNAGAWIHIAEFHIATMSSSSKDDLCLVTVIESVMRGNDNAGNIASELTSFDSAHPCNADKVTR